MGLIIFRSRFLDLFTDRFALFRFEKKLTIKGNNVRPSIGFFISSLRLRLQNTVELQWLEHRWNHENMFETGMFKLMNVNHSARSGGIIHVRDMFFFSFFFSST